MRFLSTIYISGIAGHLGMTTVYGCGHRGSVSEREEEPVVVKNNDNSGDNHFGVLVGGSESGLEPDLSSSFLTLRPITKWEDKEELEKTKKMLSDFKINGVAFDQMFLSNINVKKGESLVPVLFTASYLVGRKHAFCNHIYVKHSQDSACTRIEGYVKFKDVCVYVTALTSNGPDGRDETVPCDWDFKASLVNLESNFDKYSEIAEQFADGSVWGTNHNPKSKEEFFRAIIFSDSPIADRSL